MLRAVPEVVALVHVLALELAQGIQLFQKPPLDRLATTTTRAHPEATTTELHTQSVNLDIEPADHACNTHTYMTISTRT